MDSLKREEGYITWSMISVGKLIIWVLGFLSIGYLKKSQNAISCTFDKEKPMYRGKILEFGHSFFLVREISVSFFFFPPTLPGHWGRSCSKQVSLIYRLSINHVHHSRWENICYPDSFPFILFLNHNSQISLGEFQMQQKKYQTKAFYSAVVKVN